jgi:hypothetical protein
MSAGGPPEHRLRWPCRKAITIKMLETADFRHGADSAYLQQVDQQALRRNPGRLAMARWLRPAATLLSRPPRRADPAAQRRDGGHRAVLAAARGWPASSPPTSRSCAASMACPHAVVTMAAGDLDARVEVTSKDELGDVGRTLQRDGGQPGPAHGAAARERPTTSTACCRTCRKGILTIAAGGRIHPGILGVTSRSISRAAASWPANQPALALLCADSRYRGHRRAGPDPLPRIAACLGEDRMNFDFNSASAAQVRSARPLPDGRVKILEFQLGADLRRTRRRRKNPRLRPRRHRTASAGGRSRAPEARTGADRPDSCKVSQEKFHEFIASARAVHGREPNSCYRAAPASAAASWSPNCSATCTPSRAMPAPTGCSS